MGHIEVVARLGGGGALSLFDSEGCGWGGAYRLMEKTSLYKTM